jgi:tripartite-type tricarboxylate transporter receptor subunit TctC
MSAAAAACWSCIRRHTVQERQDVIDASKREPNKWSYGTSGVGGPHHLSGEYFKSVTGANLLHVPYKGGGPAMTDLIGGQVPMLFSSLGPVVGAAKGGRVRPIAVTSPQRSAAFPDVPTMDEVGLKGFDSTACTASSARPACRRKSSPSGPRCWRRPAPTRR